jgi:hypothetical protein
MVFIIHIPQHPCLPASTGSTHTPSPCAVLFSSPLKRLKCSLARFGQTFLSALLSFCHSYLARLPTPTEPHPEVELIEPASKVPLPLTTLESAVAPAKLCGHGGVEWNVCCHKYSKGSVAHVPAHHGILCSAFIPAGPG